jgi:CubicO group peptidase (beta-lactamase class C family)
MSHPLGHAARLTLALVAATWGAPGARAQSVDPEDLDELVERTMKAFEVPGAAIAIVRGDAVVHLKGYGVKSIGEGDPVTPDTLFKIASTTKAFTTTAMAMLIDGGKMAWDDPVRKHISFFRLADPLADREVTLRDLVTHRTGVDRPNPLLFAATDDRAGFIRRIAHFKTEVSFRSGWRYNNPMYMTAGYAVGAADGSTWEDFLRRRILEPLGMKATCFADELKSRDHASPHVKGEGKVAAMPGSRWDALNPELLGPAGSMNSTARDLSRWVRFHLGDGTFEGQRLISARQLAEMHSSQVLVDFKGPNTIWGKTFPQEDSGPFTYGLGWFVHEYRGRLEVSHAGVLDGYRAEVVLMPREKLGLVILSNLGGDGATFMNEALREGLVDQLLGLPARDWIAYYTARAGEVDARWKSVRAEQDAQRKTGTKPSLKLEDYAGIYEDPAYGAISVSLENDSLRVRWFKTRYRLDHWHFDTFMTKDDQIPRRSLVAFRLGEDGKISGLSFLGQDFRRKP